jgi:hypothetical protein
MDARLNWVDALPLAAVSAGDAVSGVVVDLVGRRTASVAAGSATGEHGGAPRGKARRRRV